jgi:hypothetical protein
MWKIKWILTKECSRIVTSHCKIVDIFHLHTTQFAIPALLPGNRVEKPATPPPASKENWEWDTSSSTIKGGGKWVSECSCSSSRATDQVSRVSHLTLSARSGLTKAFFSQHGRRTATAAPDRSTCDQEEDPDAKAGTTVPNSPTRTTLARQGAHLRTLSVPARVAAGWPDSPSWKHPALSPRYTARGRRRSPAQHLGRSVQRLTSGRTPAAWAYNGLGTLIVTLPLDNHAETK